MASFIGEYECKLDAKGRFLFPSGLKKQMHSSAPEKFVLNRGFEGCLVLWPISEWEKETARLSKLNLYKEQERTFYRMFMNGATEVKVDGHGRVLMPGHLKEFGGIDKEIVLTTMGSRIGVWSKARHDEIKQVDAGEFAQLAENVMGEIGNGDEE